VIAKARSKTLSPVPGGVLKAADERKIAVRCGYFVAKAT
jgi:hypothetical protein